MAKDVNAPRNEDTAIPTIRRVATLTLLPFFAILKMRSVLDRQVKNAITPYI